MQFDLGPVLAGLLLIYAMRAAARSLIDYLDDSIAELMNISRNLVALQKELNSVAAKISSVSRTVEAPASGLSAEDGEIDAERQLSQYVNEVAKTSCVECGAGGTKTVLCVKPRVERGSVEFDVQLRCHACDSVFDA